MILLGVEELADHSLRAVNLPDPDWLIAKFWEGVNDPHKVSANILAPEDVTIAEVDGKKIVVIFVPKAPPKKRPVYIGDNPFTGTYVRKGEGDYRYSKEEVQSILQKKQPPDFSIKLGDFSLPKPINMKTLLLKEKKIVKKQKNIKEYFNNTLTNLLFYGMIIGYKNRRVAKRFYNKL